MYPQNNKTGVLEVLEIKTFFAAQPWWTDLLRIYVGSPRGFCTDGVSRRLLKKGKNEVIYLSTIT